jgi:alpha-glucosidase
MSEWWRGCVAYQIYPRSFSDSNGDGVGDLPGITARLEHLEWLGIECVWLSPTFPSPNEDWGYDVADYYGVHPELGTMADMDALIAEATRRGIRIVLDLVPNHTSVEHPWFVDARSSRTSKYRDWYVWGDSKPDGSPPNNWTSSFLGTAWTFDEGSGQWYLHNFLPGQADLNWWNPAVHAEFDKIFKFWFDRGIAGFRIDVAHMVIKDRDLRDNPPPTESDFLLDQIRGQVTLYNANRPEVHAIYRHWRELADSYDESRMLVGETFVGRIEQVLAYYGENDELSLNFNIPFLISPFETERLRELAERTEELLRPDCTPVWTGSNHDMSRFPTRWAGGDPARARAALLMLLALRGTVFLYYGDEIGLPDTDVPLDRLLDPVSIELQPVLNRDAARTPMPWDASDGAGFTEPGVEPWLPFGDVRACNIADQRADPASTLNFARDLVALRRELPDLRAGAYAPHTANGDLWAWRRGDNVLVAVNFGATDATVDDVHGTVRIGTDRSRDGHTVAGALTLGPNEGAVIQL